jgi:hypothetical protein
VQRKDKGKLALNINKSFDALQEDAKPKSEKKHHIEESGKGRETIILRVRGIWSTRFAR